MEIIKLKQKFDQSIALALGFFDSVHLGHRAVINETIDYARRNGVKSAVFTFSNNPFAALNRNIGLVYTLEERLEIFEKLGADYVVLADFDEELRNLSADQFVDLLFSTLNIAYICCGKDYSFGRNCGGSVATLTGYAAYEEFDLNFFDFVKFEGAKISSSLIRKLLEDGDIITANQCLGEPYFITGTVKAGRGEGKRIGIPTVNIDIPSDKIKIKEGVYITSVNIDDKFYSSVTNIGAKPTFGDFTQNIETHIIGFSGDLYGQKIKINFHQRLRDTIVYPSAQQLTEQIKKDIDCSQGFCYTEFK